MLNYGLSGEATRANSLGTPLEQNLLSRNDHTEYDDTQVIYIDAEAEKNIEAYPGTKRNDPCPCGSGKKYKQCHGK